MPATTRSSSNRPASRRKGALLSCPCAPASGDFADQYTKEFGQEPGTYSAEGYDLGTIMLKGIDTGHVTRPALLDFVRTSTTDRASHATISGRQPASSPAR